MRQMNYILAILLLFVVPACSDKQDNPVPQMDCTELVKNIVDNDLEALQEQINAYFSDLTPKPTEEDRYGNEDHFNRFVADLEQCSDISIISKCYGCIYTLPPMSEIGLKITYQDTEVECYLDLHAQEGKVLKLVGMH